MKQPKRLSSRPLHRESIYLHFQSLQCSLCFLVLVPSTGNLYIYISEARIEQQMNCSRPLHGESIYLREKQLHQPSETDGSRPIHGESIYLLAKTI